MIESACRVLGGVPRALQEAMPETEDRKHGAVQQLFTIIFAQRVLGCQPGSGEYLVVLPLHVVQDSKRSLCVC